MKCTHVALQVHRIEESIAFYRRYCRMRVVHERPSDEGRVAWMGWGEDPPAFVIVLLQRDGTTNTPPALQHLGLAVQQREEVDAIYEQAVADGLTGSWPPEDGGPIVGYFCGVRDPDGNMVEFSHGQPLG